MNDYQLFLKYLSGLPEDEWVSLSDIQELFPQLKYSTIERLWQSGRIETEKRDGNGLFMRLTDKGRSYMKKHFNTREYWIASVIIGILILIIRMCLRSGVRL